MWRLGISQEVAFSAVVAVMGLTSLGLGGWLSYQTHFRHPKYRYIPASEEWQAYLSQLVHQAQTPLESGPSSPSSILVDISGAVVKPGVYALSESSRLQDAVLMAGGFLPEASQQFIHQEVNLASSLHDQQKIYIPLVGESIASGNTTPETSRSGTDNSPVGVLSLRTATKSDLEALEGIGEARAESILAGYPYLDEADFLERSGVPRTLAQELLESSITLE